MARTPAHAKRRNPCGSTKVTGKRCGCEAAEPGGDGATQRGGDRANGKVGRIASGAGVTGNPKAVTGKAGATIVADGSFYESNPRPEEVAQL